MASCSACVASSGSIYSSFRNRSAQLVLGKCFAAPAQGIQRAHQGALGALVHGIVGEQPAQQPYGVLMLHFPRMVCGQPHHRVRRHLRQPRALGAQPVLERLLFRRQSVDKRPAVERQRLRKFRAVRTHRERREFGQVGRAHTRIQAECLAAALDNRRTPPQGRKHLTQAVTSALFREITPEDRRDAFARDGSRTVGGENGKHALRLARGDGHFPAVLVVEAKAAEQRQTEFRHGPGRLGN